jgi:arginine decarboxylase
MTPKKVFFTKGVGRHKEKLASFELALRDAGIEKFNLVCVSSILPPNCKIITKEKGLPELTAGEIVHCVLARNETDENNRLIVASIGCAIPSDSNAYGYLSEHHSFGETEEKAGDYAEDLAASMLATTLGIEFDSEKAWNEREQEYKASGKIIRTRNITQSAEGKSGLWTTVVAVTVFIEQENGQQVQQPAQQSAHTVQPVHQLQQQSHQIQSQQHPTPTEL